MGWRKLDFQRGFPQRGKKLKKKGDQDGTKTAPQQLNSSPQVLQWFDIFPFNMWGVFFFFLLMYFKPSILSGYVMGESNSCDTQSLPKSLPNLPEILEDRAAIYWWEDLPGGPDLHTQWSPGFLVWSGKYHMSQKWSHAGDNLEMNWDLICPFFLYCGVTVAIIKNEMETSIWFREAKH